MPQKCTCLGTCSEQQGAKLGEGWICCLKTCPFPNCNEGSYDTGAAGPHGEPIFQPCPWSGHVPTTANPKHLNPSPKPSAPIDKWIINPEWVELLEKDLQQARAERDEWLWCCSLLEGILEKRPGWETAKEYRNFGGGNVENPGAKLAKRVRALADIGERWEKNSSLEAWFPITCENMARWLPRRTDPNQSGYYYVREVQPRLVIGIRYFDDSNQSWWAISKGQLVPNETFHDWLVIPGISDKQGSNTKSNP